MIEQKTKIFLKDYNKFLDLDTNGYPLEFSYSINDIRNFGSINTAMSKTITLPGTNNNNEIFGNLFDINVEDFTFNLNARTDVIVYQNDDIVFQGYLQLEKINKFFDNTNYSLSVNYEVKIYEITADFFNKIKASKLEDLDYSKQSHQFYLSAITQSYNHTYLDHYTYPLLFKKNDGTVTGDTRLVNDFRPAIYIKSIFDKIFFNAGYSYESNFLNSDFFKNLIVLGGNDVIQEDTTLVDRQIKLRRNTSLIYEIRYDKENSKIDFLNNEYLYQYPPDLILKYKLNTSSDIENLTPGDFEPIFVNKLPFQYKDSDTLNQVSLPYVFTSAYDGSADFKINADFSIVYKNLDDWNYLKESGLNAASVNFYIAKKTSSTLGTLTKKTANGDNVSMDTNKILVKQITIDIPIQYTVVNTDGTENLKNYFPTFLEKQISFQIPFSLDILFEKLDLLKGEEYYFYWSFNIPIDYYPVPNDPGKPKKKRPNLDITLQFDNLTIDNSITRVIGEGDIVKLEKYLPKDTLQTDFFKGISQMFNLYFERIKDKDNTYRIEPRDDFYNNDYKILDWSKKIDNTEKSLSYLTEILNKRYIFSFEDSDETWYADYKKETGYNYGYKVINFNNAYLSGEYVIQPMFYPTATLFDGNNYVPAIDITDSSKLGIRILYAKKSNGYYRVKALKELSTILTNPLNRYTTYSFNEYIQALNTDDINNPTFSLNWENPDYDFCKSLKYSNATLYEKYWSNFINQIANSKLLTAKFNLTSKDINELQFNDRIWINDSYYILQTIEDYTLNDELLTTCTLLKMDDSLIFKQTNNEVFEKNYPEKYKLFNSINQKKTWTIPTYDDYSKNNSITNTKDSLFIGGKNNTVTSNSSRTILQGNDNYVDSPNTTIIASNNNVVNKSKKTKGGEYESTIIIGSNNNVITDDARIIIGGYIFPSNGGDIIQGFNLVDGGEDIVVDKFSPFSANIIDGGEDEVRALPGAQSSVGYIDGGETNFS